MNCVKGEIHNVLSMMRVNARWASADRFTQEIPASTQSPMMRAFKQLHYELQSVTDLADVDTVTYLLPFVMVIESERTSGIITGAAISAVNKFLLYGLITCESLRADVAINRIAVCVYRCRFEETHRADDEAVLMKLLELVEYAVRCDAGHLISGDNLWKMLQLCYSIRSQTRSSMHLCRSADNTLSHLVLTVFDRIDELGSRRKSSPSLTPISPQVLQDKLDTTKGEEDTSQSIPEYDDSLEIAEKTTVAPEDSTSEVAKTVDKPYGIPLLERILHFISRLTSPMENEEMTCVQGLRLINVVLETAGTGLGNHPCLVSVLQGDLSKFLLQNSETEELGILSLTLRVVFNLFNSIKDHLKVQLEVFFTSVHMRIIDSPSCSDEQKELALESLLEFCREPALMLDLYINYDCDVHCTNLFEVLCKSLAKNCQSMSGADGSLNALTLLCLEGLLAVIESIARRCPLNPTKTSGSKTFGSNSDVLSLKGSHLARFATGARPDTENTSGDFPMEDISPMSSVRDLMHLMMSGSESDSDSEQSEQDNSADQLAWLHTARERTAEVLQQRKRAKKRYALAAEKFNHDQKNWMAYSQQIGLLPAKLTPESVASFLLHTPGLNKTLIGDYIGDGPVEKYPFNAAVRDAYVAMFDFRSAQSLDEALRMFLAKFRLPGEAQKIDRMMEAFSKQLYLQAGSSGPLADADAAYVLSFSIIMLNTDLHSDHIAKKMTAEEFLRNNRGINAGQDLPTEYLTNLYYNILEKEIQMQHDVSDFVESSSSTVDRYSMQWEGVLKRSENVVGASFTSNTSILNLRAGLYEKDMFNLISESTINSILLAFERTCDLNNMERALEGLSNCAKIMLYYGMLNEFNKIMGALSSYFLTFAHGILSGEKVYMPPSSLKHSASTSLPSSSEHGLTVASGERIVHRQDDGSEIEILAASQQPGSFIDEDIVQGAKTRRALLSLKLLFQFVQNKSEYFRKGWAHVVECMLMFNELDAVPMSLVEIDDFVDSRGVPLPPMQGGTPIHASSQSKLSSGRGQSGTGLSGKTRERSRRQAERQAAIRSRMKSMTQASQGTAYGSHGQSVNSSSLWGSLSYYLWAEEEKIDESFSLVNKMLREEVMTLGGGILEKENWLRLTRKLQEKSLTSLLETLILCRDPFKCIVQASDSGVDAMMQENAILVLELSVDTILVNSHRILQLNLWDFFHLYAKRILSTPLSELHMQGLVERVVVHILRVSIRLFHNEQVRPKLMATLELLLTMDQDINKALSDRIASGITMLLKANCVYMHDFYDWKVLLGILSNVVGYINSRSACWESVIVLAEGGHLNDDNFAPWMSLCCEFVRHRTSYAVDALKLLQGLANSDNTYNMKGSSWLQVMRVMLNYLNDDRPPVAKTAWDCLRNSLLLPGVPIAKDTWNQCFDDIIFAFDDQVNDITATMARDAPLYSVTLLSKTFLHNLNILMELPNFPELWLNVLRRLANKLVASSSPSMQLQQLSVVFETALQSLYNLLLVLKAEDILERVNTESSTGTLFDETCAVIDAVCPHLKEQLGLVPDDITIDMVATSIDGREQIGAAATPDDDAKAAEIVEITGHFTEVIDVAVTTEVTKTDGANDEVNNTMTNEEMAKVISQDEDAESVDKQQFDLPNLDKFNSEALEPAISISSGYATSTTTLETVVIGDGTFGIKVDEVIVDEITEAV
ncbi:unnamed protein product [Peronospora destructor]|uniref:SEC7 domain-containing protein n=1 Tax=Peronospora destructor TaxID=86335 RepID=A0AAV0UWP3_9STRA|nr:unnamed protein product [Peronospora destructor]